MIKKKAHAEATPAELGFSMPAEWERHEATWLAWPHNPSDWPDKLDTIRWVYGEMVRKIATREKVRMLVDNGAAENLARHYLRRARADVSRVEFIFHPTNRGWTRDSGPIFVAKKKQGQRPQSSISTSTPGPNIAIGKRTGGFPKQQRNSSRKSYSTRSAMGKTL